MHPSPIDGAPRAHTLSDFDFVLPPELIAQHPAAQRSASRLLDGTGSTPVDRFFDEPVSQPARQFLAGGLVL